MAGAKRITGETVGFDPETAMAFSVIDSGCIVLRHGGKTVFAIKDPALALLPGNGCEPNGFEPGISFHFEHVARDEFPSVCAVLSVDAGAGKRFGYDYFFMPDSPADTEALSLLCEMEGGEVWFSGGGEPFVRFRVSFDRGESEKIARARALATGG